MHVSVTGISHHETTISLRERFAFATDELRPALELLAGTYTGAALLSTCNRTELYLTSEELLPSSQGVDALARARGSQSADGIAFYHYSGAEAVNHLYRVAAGIDSLVIGESEILGQVREAFSAATAVGTADPVLARLFHTAMRVGRRARNETEISAHGLSVAAIAVSLSKAALGDLRHKTVLVVGAGEAGQRAASALAQAGAGRLIVTTRTAGRAEEIAAGLAAEALPFSDLASALAESDVVITATSATEPVISRAQLQHALCDRAQRPMVIVDIAVPRDVEPSARQVPNLHLFDIDDLQAVGDRNLEARRREVGAVEAIVADEVSNFEAWLQGRAVIPTVAALQRQAERARLTELERTLTHMPELSSEDRRRIEAMSKALVKRLLHAPITRLRHPSGQRQLDAARHLFNLDDEASQD